MSHPSSFTVYTSNSNRGLATAIVVEVSARAHVSSQLADIPLLADHSVDHGRALVLVPPGHGAWGDKQLHALEGSILIGDLSSGTALLRGLTAGASAAINSHVPLASLVDEVEAALSADVSRYATDTSPLVQRLRVRVEEHSRIASLTDREFEILGFLYAGSNVDRIGRTAHITLTTIRTHIRSILQKLDVHSQVEACAMLRRSDHGARRESLERRIGRY